MVPAVAQEKTPLPQPTHANVRNGPQPTKNVLDFWQTDSKRPTPILVSIHHGGFSQGQKFVKADLLKDCLATGISVAAINYRLTEQAIAPAMFHDCARAVQFLRHKAKEWNLDPTRVACTGGSSGGGLSLWLAFHDDLADAKSDDPVLRLSTRIVCAAVFNAQTTYDPRVIRNLFPESDVHKIQNIGYLLGVKPDQLGELPTEKYRLCEQISPLTHLTKDDPPVLLGYQAALDAKVTTPGIGIHHPRFGKLLKDRMDELKIPCELHAGRKDVNTIDFLRKHFKMER
jgi:acetyl esterase/lipase